MGVLQFYVLNHSFSVGFFLLVGGGQERGEGYERCPLGTPLLMFMLLFILIQFVEYCVLIFMPGKDCEKFSDLVRLDGSDAEIA